MQYRADSNRLRQAGLSEPEISRLEHFRQRYAAEQDKLDDAAFRRLRFVRWLVETGKLTEQIRLAA
jgi:hypothetical protein